MKLSSYASGNGAISFTWEDKDRNAMGIIVSPLDVIRAGLGVNGWVLWYHDTQVEMFEPCESTEDPAVISLHGELYHCDWERKELRSLSDGITMPAHSLAGSAITYYAQHRERIHEQLGATPATLRMGYQVLAIHSNGVTSHLQPSGLTGVGQGPDFDITNRAEARRLYHTLPRENVERRLVANTQLHCTRAQVAYLHAMAAEERRLMHLKNDKLDGLRGSMKSSDTKRLRELEGAVEGHRRKAEEFLAEAERTQAMNVLAYSAVIACSTPASVPT